MLVLHAHPDDEAIFTGVTIRRLADRGARVVLATATAGELGEVLVSLDPGETVAQRRVRELERAAETLGVERLVLLGRRDSGLPGWDDNAHADALVRAPVPALARRIADLAAEERAEAIVHYDANGIYGHPDHVAVHRVGALAAELAGVPGYQSTVDREHLHFAGTDAHLVHAASRATATAYGHVTAEIGLAVAGTPAELAAKRAAIAVHASQVRPAAVAHAAFADAYQMEWYVRTGGRAVLDELGNAHVFA
ncbi:MAG: PIG-L family deacetylase [Streptosporangiales bacterium]|nr:PIG-L family deacetylase [Streptosporangiales bacterium]